MAKKKYVFKLVIAGAGGVGKTTLLTRAVTGKFVQNTQMTIGVEFHLLNFMIGPEDRDDSLQCTLQLWDFGGQERFRFMLDSYVAGARGALLLYDLTRLRTLDGLEEWVNIVRKHDPNLPILFLGTKLDRVEDITVSDDYAKEFLEPLNLFGLMKVSSKDGTGVRAAFKAITRRILELNGIQTPADPDDLDLAKIAFAKSVKPFTISQAPAAVHPEPSEVKPTHPPFTTPLSTPSSVSFAAKPSQISTFGSHLSPKPTTQTPLTQRPFTAPTTTPSTSAIPGYVPPKTTTSFTPRPFTSSTSPTTTSTTSTPGSSASYPPKTTSPFTPHPYQAPPSPTTPTSTPSTTTPSSSITPSPANHRPYIPPTTPTSNIASTIPPIPPKTTTPFTPRPYQAQLHPIPPTYTHSASTPTPSTTPSPTTPRPYISSTTPSPTIPGTPSSFASRPPPVTPGAKPQPFTPRPYTPSTPQVKEKESIQPPIVDLKPWEKKTDKPTKQDESSNTS